MALQVSTGLRNYMLDTGSLADALALGFINIYAGSPPADADAAIGGATLLLQLTESGDGSTGLNMAAAAVNGVLSKLGSETWQGTVLATDTAAWYRHVEAADDGSASTTLKRIQGVISTAGADMNFTDTALIEAAVETVNSYSIALPTY